MVDFLPIVKIAPLFVAAMVSPGPDFLLVSSTAMRQGRWAGIKAGCGIALGASFYATLCLFGLGVVLASMHLLAMGVRIAGGLYLIYLGVMLWRGSFRPATETISESVRRNPFLAGLITNLTNPKVMAFFSSIFALTLPPHIDTATQTSLIMLFLLLPLAWFALVSVFLSAPRMREMYVLGRCWIDRVAGSCMAFFGARLLLSRN